MLAEKALKDAGVDSRIVVDCSHANSMKNPDLQPFVLNDCITQIVNGNKSICGVMLESNINAGNQKIPADLSQLNTVSPSPMPALTGKPPNMRCA